MPRRYRSLLVILALILLLFITAKYSLSPIVIGEISDTTPTEDPLRIEVTNMISQYKSGEISIIDLSTLSLSWDHLYIIEPYTQPSDLDSIVGKSWRKNCFSEISTSDSFTLLVFTDNDVVIHCIELPRSGNIFNIPISKYKEGFSPDEAVFRLGQQERIIWVDKNDVDK